MPSLPRAVLVMVALGLAAPAATAGPIPWTYTATFAGDQNPAFLDLGHYARPDATEPTGVRHGRIFGTPAAVNGGETFTGSTRLRVGQLAQGGVGILWDDETPPPGGVSPGFAGGLTITDARSKVRGDFPVFGTGGLTGDPMLFAFTLGLALEGPVEREQVLGGTRYRVRFDTEATDTAAWLVADVSVGPVVMTPEPGTLALAGVGVAAAWIFRRRRRC